MLFTILNRLLLDLASLEYVSETSMATSTGSFILTLLIVHVHVHVPVDSL